jgi:ATP-dependent Clp protease ATP-binding subunit ClpC
LDLPSLLASAESSEKVESILDTIFQEVILAGNVILFIDEFHNFVGGPTRPGIIDISGSLIPYLRSPSFQIVAITTFKNLHENIEQNPSLLAFFEKVEVSEISERETLLLLENLVLALEYKYKKFISYPALRDIITFCAKYLPTRPFPEKAMGLLDETMVYLTQTKEAVLLPEHVAKIFTEKTQIPVSEIEIKERKVLLNLENLIHQRIINQEEAIKGISTALRRARTEITIRKGPMGCFLFLGPTGVGKTETSKALAEIYFGSEEKMIRLDMSEFQAIEDIPRLLGAPGQEGLLTTPVRENPFSLILLDETEKAHSNILNLFLQVFDEGHLTDGQGRKVDFKNTIIIATSNAAYQVILQALEEKIEWSGVKEKLLNYCFEKGIFRPEFINRFDGVIIFRPLSKENLLDIAELLFQKLKKNLLEKGIEFVITQSLKEKIVELGYEPTFGARAMRRVIQDKVENVLAQALLSGEIKRGDKIEIDPSDFKLKIV